jgi:hypothetical protein
MESLTEWKNGIIRRRNRGSRAEEDYLPKRRFTTGKKVRQMVESRCKSCVYLCKCRDILPKIRRSVRKSVLKKKRMFCPIWEITFVFSTLVLMAFARI